MKLVSTVGVRANRNIVTVGAGVPRASKLSCSSLCQGLLASHTMVLLCIPLGPAYHHHEIVSACVWRV
jgi:hypothetical protein